MLRNAKGSLTLIDCSFEENEANEDSHLGGDGGAIWSEGKLSLEDTQVGTVTQPNLSGGEGGGIYMAAGGSLGRRAASMRAAAAIAERKVER